MVISMCDPLDGDLGNFRDSSAVDEKRLQSRRRVLKPASILFGGGSIDCVIRNQSETGAALDVVSPLGIPIEFSLMEAGSDTGRRCFVVWRKEKRIGIRYL